MKPAHARRLIQSPLLNLLAAAGLLAAGSCRHAAPADVKVKPETDAAAPATAAKSSLVTAPDETPLGVPPIATTADPSKLPLRSQPDEKGMAATEYPSRLIQDMAGADVKKPVTFNFDAAPMTDVVPVFADTLHFNYYIDPSIKGGITLKMVDTELTGREVWDLFEHILWLSGAYADPTPGMINILPLSKMPQSRRIFAKHDPVANVEVAMIPVRYGKSAEISALLKPFMTDGGVVTDLARTNTLLLVDCPANMGKLREIVSQLDAKGEAGWPVGCLPCRNVDPEDLVAELMSLLPVLGLPATAEKAAVTGGTTPTSGPSAAATSTGGTGIKLVPLKRLQMVVFSAPSQDLLTEVEKWIRVLDEDNASEKESVFFYNIHHSTAPHLSEMLDTFFNTTTVNSSTSESGTGSTGSSSGSSSSGSRSGSSSTSTTSTGFNRTGTSSSNNRTATAANRNSATGSTAQKSATDKPTTVFDVPATVYADSSQNRLIIRTTPRTYTMLRSLLERLDVQPRQVKIQAIIAEITLNKNTEFGFNYAVSNIGTGLASNTSGNINNIASGPSLYTAASGATPASTLNNAFISSGAALLLKNSSGDKMALIRAVAGETNVRVLSRPEIVAKNDEQAYINVGNRVPILSGTSNTGTTTNNSTTTVADIQYQDTGIQLTVAPHITAANEVSMQIRQQVSDAVANTSSTIDSPIIQQRDLQTSLIIPNGGTAIMGGMIQSKDDDGHSGIPFLKDIPWLGALFRTNATIRNRTELLVLISVEVIDQNSDADALANRYQAALREVKEKSAAPKIPAQ